ncbi:MAG: class I SAM-dependent RNA methyltransferase [Bacteroidales bacterium]|nr:class I SAM-dependent RNA methyltransferase [Bacteroidales bacterium]
MGHRKQKPLLENVRIEAVAAEGNSLSHVDGKVLFVPQTVPGDVVDVQVTRMRKGYMEGYVVRLVSPSPDRLEPVCKHYGDCGGCKWQILPYGMQLAAKQQQVVDQLSRIGHLDLPEISPIMGSDLQYFYRNKLEYTFSSRRWILRGEDPESISPADRCGLGFHVGGMFDKVLDIDFCHLQAEPSNAIRNFVRSYAVSHHLSFFDLREQTGLLRNMVVRTASTGEIMVTVVFGPEGLESAGGASAGDALDSVAASFLTLSPGSPAASLLDSLVKEFPQITSLNYVINSKRNDSINDLEAHTWAGRDCIYEQMESLRFKVGPKSFYQTNSAQAYRLYSVVRSFALDEAGLAALGKYVAVPQKPVVYDLYTGTGTIALFLSAIASKVVGIEYVPEAIEDAKANAALNSIDNATFYAGDMKDVLNSSFIADNGAPSIVVLDPPRAGIHPDVASVLLEAAPARIIYVSCNPASQARDLALFADYYDILAVQPVDMFPQTHHVENVVYLARRVNPKSL